jgi:hypothetical protein
MAHKKFRNKLPDERASITHKFCVAGHEGYITVGLYPDGRPGEVFITMSKMGSTISGLLDAFAVQTSIALQYNVPLDVMTGKFKHLRFEPAGITPNPAIRNASSVIDYLFKWLEMKFLPKEDADEFDAGRPLAEMEPKPEELEARHNEVIGRISPPPAPRLDPDKMHGAGDGFGGSDEGSHYMSQTSAADLRGEDPVLAQAREISETLAPLDPTADNGDSGDLARTE